VVSVAFVTGGVAAATVQVAEDADMVFPPTSSIGFGIFYMVVNIGAFIGPFVTGFVRKFSWDYVFYTSAAVIAFNFILLTFLYKEPVQKIKSAVSFKDQVKQIFGNIGKALSDWRFTIFLLIIGGFWTMFNQFYMTLPVFIDQWVDTRVLFNFLDKWWPWLAHNLGTDQGTIPAEYLLNVDAGSIILFQIIISAIVMRFKPLRAMMAGIIVNAIGIGLALTMHNGIFVALSLIIFAIGEMSTSPKITEYIGRIAPPDKTALYMGCSYIPVAIGYLLAGVVSGNVYQGMSDKITLLQREVSSRGISLPSIGENFTKNDFFTTAASKMNMSPDQLTQFLWDKYHPSSFWMVVVGIGFGAAFLLLLYDRYVLKKK
jgi:dipeptide/tripeptide permease